ncbi:MAG TPA: hypothetical protein VMN38_02575 [Sphingomicrobium sp.]|nr:hypothetical protein [Sphingomicrobium sp.]
MRIPIVLPLLLLGACEVTTDDANDQVTVEYNQGLAENSAADVANEVGNIADDIGNDVERTGDRIQNEVGDVDVDVSRNAPANSN